MGVALTWTLLGLGLLAGLLLLGRAIGRGLSELAPAKPVSSALDVHPWPEDYMPLIVTVGPESWALKMAVQIAVRWWNTASGMQLFLPMVLDVGPGESARHRLIHISLASIESGRTAARMAVRFDRGTDQGGIRKSVSLPPEMGEDCLDRLVARELGHALGLDSDQDPASVMWHCQSKAGPDKCGPLSDCVLSHAHRQDLRRWYHGLGGDQDGLE